MCCLQVLHYSFGREQGLVVVARLVERAILARQSAPVDANDITVVFLVWLDNQLAFTAIVLVVLEP